MFSCIPDKLCCILGHHCRKRKEAGEKFLYFSIQSARRREGSKFSSLGHVRLSVTPWTAACQASLSITHSRSLLKLLSTESVMPSNHLILCSPLVLLPSIFPSIRVFSNESVLHIGWPKYWSFSLSISPSSEYSGLTSFRIDSEKAMTPHSRTRAWKIPWMEEPGRLRSMGLRRVGHD